MSERFGQRAMQLYAIAAQTLGWRPDDFWAATPAELATALALPGGTEAAPLGREELGQLMARLKETDNG